MRQNGKRKVAAKARAEDDGCLFVLLLVLWSSGFITFNWPWGDSPEEHEATVRVELEAAESRLVELGLAINAIQRDSLVLGSRRAELAEQVEALKRIRDQVASSLEEAGAAIATSGHTGWRRWLDTLFTGVVGNLISAALLFWMGWVVRGRRHGRDRPVAGQE